MQQSTESLMKQAAELLKKGGVIVFPTDTAYALGGDFQNDAVTERILKIKKRSNTKFTIIAASLSQVQRYFDLSERAIEIAMRYWPGPLSIVVNERFSVRVPDNDIARALAESFGKPLIATSANLSGKGETYSVADAQYSLGKNVVDLWVDGGTLEKRPPSTIISVNTNTVQIIRSGAIDIDATTL